MHDLAVREFLLGRCQLGRHKHDGADHGQVRHHREGSANDLDDDAAHEARILIQHGPIKDTNANHELEHGDEDFLVVQKQRSLVTVHEVAAAGCHRLLSLRQLCNTIFSHFISFDLLTRGI